MTTTVNVSNGARLATSAAASITRALADGMPPDGVTSSYRSTEAQAIIFEGRYAHSTGILDRGPFGDRRGPWKGKHWKRMRGLPASIPGTSDHNTGLALDLSTHSRAHAWLVKHGGAYGWRRPLASTDPVHFRYAAADDDVRKGIGPHVTTARLNVRTAASTSSPVRRVLAKGATVTVKARKNAGGLTWGAINGGWVATKHLKRKKP